MALAIGAQGTLFKIGNGASSEAFTTVPETHKLQAPNIKFDLLDTSSHDTAVYKEYIPGLADGENAQASIWFVPTNSVHIGIRTDSLARTKRNFEIIFPGGGTGAQMAFSSYITGFSPTADVNTVLVAQVTAKVTGAVTWT